MNSHRFAASSKAQRQPLVYLDVGGQAFRISSDSLENYPDSLLTRMMHEFPELVERGEALFVDRSPKTFEWILEIYRNGDYRSCVPRGVSNDALQHDLDFYQLPCLEELGLATMELGFQLKESYAEGLVVQILQEIEACGLRDFFPWTVYIYKAIENGKPDSRRRVCIHVPRVLCSMEWVNKRGHFTFLDIVSMRNPTRVEEGFLVFSVSHIRTTYAVQVVDDELLEILNPVALKWGLQFSKRRFDLVSRTNEPRSYHVLRLRHG